MRPASPPPLFALPPPGASSSGPVPRGGGGGGAPLAVGIMVGAVAAGVAGALLSAVMAPAGGIYFAAGSLAVGELVRVALLSFHYQVPVGADLTGPAGADGFRGVRALFTGGGSVGAFMLASMERHTV